MNINEAHWKFSANGTKEPAKPIFKLLVFFNHLEFFDAVFTIVFKRMSSIIYVSLSSLGSL